MIKVIFICLLSLSMCLSRPDGQPAPPLAQPAEVPATNTKTPVVPEQSQQTITSQPNEANATQPGKTSESPAPATQNVPQNETAAPHTTEDGKVTPKDTNENKTVPEKKEPDASKDNQSTTANSTAKTTNTTEKDQGNATTESTVATSTVPNSTKKNETVTDKSDAAKTTEAPKHENTVVQARGFDGASFIGGIILTLGLLAIGFMGFKYYKNQTERNYHTL